MSKTRGEQRFAGLTYSQIAEWCGLKPSTVQSYAKRGRFNVRDLAGTLRWVNSRRARLGLPLIGDPAEPDTIEPVADPPAATTKPACGGNSGGYNPQTGEY